jgi:hypothetical protein
MRNVLKNNPITMMWNEAENLLDYTLALWATALSMLAFSGILVLVIELITNPSAFDNATFGIFDTLGS